jgi:hypothetical protein
MNKILELARLKRDYQIAVTEGDYEGAYAIQMNIEIVEESLELEVAHG